MSTLDGSSPSFAAARGYIEAHAHDFADLALSLRYRDGSGSRQLVAQVSGPPGGARLLWPAAAAFNRISGELVVLVSSDRVQFPYARVMRAFS